MSGIDQLTAAMPDYTFESTASGDMLLLADAGLTQTFKEAMLAEAASPDGGAPNTFIGMGRNARVSEIPGYPNLCIKTSTPWIGRAAYLTGKSNDPENLIVQLRFMERLRLFLSTTASQHGIKAPTQYVAARNDHGINISVQERLPEDIIPFRNYLRTHNVKEKKAKTASHTVNDRIKEAVGSSLLRFGIDDIWVNGSTNGGNVLVPQDAESLDNAELYVIDLPHKRTKIASAIMAILDKTG